MKFLIPIKNNKYFKIVSKALKTGLEKQGQIAEIIFRDDLSKKEECIKEYDFVFVFTITGDWIRDLAIKYGKPYIYMDKGYCRNARLKKPEAFIRFSPNSWQPLKHLDKFSDRDDRWEELLKIPIRKWYGKDGKVSKVETLEPKPHFKEEGEYILFAGSSAKYHLYMGIEEPTTYTKNIVKEIRQGGRTVGRLQMDAEVLKYSAADDGHDLALLRIRKLNFVADTVTFYLDKKIPPLGEDLLHVGSLLGQMGANSMTDGIYSQHGRIIKSLNKHVFDQTTVTAFPGSSGGGVYLKKDAKYVGMLVRGAGEGFNLIVPVRRMIDYCEKHKIMWALDRNVEMPSEEELKNMPIENSPKEKKEALDLEKEAAKKQFPFRLRVTYPRVLILKENTLK